MKHVLVLAQSINQAYIDQLAEALGDNAKIDVISGEEVSGKNICWIQSPKHDSRSILSRLKCWISHWLFVRSWSRQKNNSYDLIYAVSNPPINSYIGIQLKKYFNAPFVYMNWDIYPDIIESSMRSVFVKIVCNIWRAWNMRNYPKIDCMLTLGNKMADSIRNSVKAAIYLKVIPIGVDVKQLVPVRKKENLFLRKHRMEDKFIVLFSGKMGIGHNMEIILDAANKLQYIQDIEFVLIGEGSKFQMIREYLHTHKPKNVQLYPWQDSDIYPYSIACGDIAIVTEEKAAEGLMIPSRVFSMMACGEAIIGICGRNDDLFSIVEKNGIGACVINDDVYTLVNIIESLYRDKQQLENMKEKARKLAVNMYSLNRVTQAYRELFQWVERKNMY